MSTQRIWLITLAQVALLAGATLGLMILLQPNLTPQTDPALLLSTAAIAPLTLLIFAATLASFIPYTLNLAPYILLAATGLAVGLGATIPWETSQILASGHWGLSNMYEVSVLTLGIIGTLALGFNQSHGHGKLLPFVTPILTVAASFTWWLTSIGASTPSELVPALQNSILPFHVIANFIGYGCFAIGAAASAAILLRTRYDKKFPAPRHPDTPTSSLPTTETLERLAYQAIVIGFPVFSVAILLGCIWAYQAWGGYWSWDPKETWALIVWLMYAAYLHARAGLRPRPVILAWWLLAGFMATLFCYVGVNMFLSGLHSYGSLAT